MKLKRTFKIFLIALLSGVYFSGVFTWVLSNWLYNSTPLGDEPSPLRVVWLQGHSILSLFFMVVFGYLWHSHIRPAWMRGRKRKSGATLTSSLVFLMLTVPFLFYSANENFKSATVIAHTYVGLTVALLFAIHLRSSWKFRN